MAYISHATQVATVWDLNGPQPNPNTGEVSTLTIDVLPGLDARLSGIEAMLAEILGMLASPKKVREWYTVEEVAKMLDKTSYTVREWCREGRINATKRSERRGGAELWNVSAAEVARYKDEGLLDLDPDRNNRN